MGHVSLAPGWQAHLRARGYRLTPARQLVLEAVGTLGHATPEEIVGQVRQTARGVNISTVYRTLDLLEHLGLVTHAHLGHGAPTYHVAGEVGHVHLVCHQCDRVIEEDAGLIAALAETLLSRHGFEIDKGHFAVSGLCADCARLTRAGTSEPPEPVD